MHQLRQFYMFTSVCYFLLRCNLNDSYINKQCWMYYVDHSKVYLISKFLLLKDHSRLKIVCRVAFAWSKTA